MMIQIIRISIKLIVLEYEKNPNLKEYYDSQ